MISKRFALATVLPFLLASCSSPDPATDPGAESPLVEARDAAPAAGSPTDTTTSFGQVELEALVREILAVAPEQPRYTYPAEIRMVELDAKGRKLVNAHAGILKKDGEYYPYIEMFRGLVDLADGDPRVLRAVLAHEIAHLSLGHALENFQLRDLAHHHTRQEEREADAHGVRYLEALGYDREDMVDMLQMLDRHSKSHNVPWLASVAGDHASCMTRAAYLTGDDALLAAVSRLEIGLAYMECRRYEQALTFFDEALALQPDIHEASLNAASAALQNYYDRLPAAVQDAWLRPEFGPHLTDVRALAGRAIQVTPLDLARYQQALDRIEACPPNWYDTMRRFLSATALVLDPVGNQASIRAGVEQLDAILAEATAAGGWDYDAIRLGVVNNLALGLARIGEPTRAMGMLVQEQAKDMRYVPAVAENFSRLTTTGLSKDQIKTVLTALMHFVRFSPAGSPDARAAARVIERLARQNGFTVPEVASRVPLAYGAVATMVIDDHEVGLFEQYTEIDAILGSLKAAGKIHARHEALYFGYWGDREVVALVENDQLVKLTSYRPGSYLELRPTRATGIQDVQRVRVGMSEAELEALLQPAGGDATLKRKLVYLLDRSSFKSPTGESEKPTAWRYYPTLNFGVSILDGAVAGITVTPVK